MIAAALTLFLVVITAVGAGAASPTTPTPAPLAVAAKNEWLGPLGDVSNTSFNGAETSLTPANASTLTRVWTKAEYGTGAAPTIIGGMSFVVVSSGNANLPSSFVAHDLRTGRVVWTTPVPPASTYVEGVVVVGNLAVVAFRGWKTPGGLVAVDLQNRKVKWWRFQQPDSTGVSASYANELVADTQRVYLSGGGDNAFSAYRLSDGAALYRVTKQDYWQRGIALHSGLLYMAGDHTTAYDAATGRLVWEGSYGGSNPIIAGDRVMVANSSGVVGYPETSCRQSSPMCSPRWVTSIADSWFDPNIGAAGGGTIYATYIQNSNRQGIIKRLSISTGEVLWTGDGGRAPGPPVRAGNTVWMVDNGQWITGYAASSRTRAPLVRVKEPFVIDTLQGISIAQGHS